MKKAYAYDPIEDIDVEIDCSHKHVNTEYDRIDGGSFPVVINSDFRHESVEGCQGTFTQIEEIEGGCPNCNYDRMNVSVHTLAGIHREQCRACGVDITDRNREDWTAKKPLDITDDIKKNCEYIGKTHRNGVKLYRRNERLFALISHGNSLSINREDWLSLAYMMLNEYDDDEDPLNRQDAHRLLRAIVRAMEKTDEEEDDD